MWLIGLVSVLYVLAPGHPQLPLGGLPIGQTGIVALVLLIGAWSWARPFGSQSSSGHSALPIVRTAVLCGLVVAKLGVAWVAPDIGWLGRYYANEDFTPPIERSIDFCGLNGTRLDRDLSFSESEFPVHYLNDRRYNTGVFREWTEPFSVHWTGHLLIDAPVSVPLRLTARGRAQLIVDGVEVAAVTEADGPAGGQGEATLALSAGPHVIDVRYQKPPETAGLLRLQRVVDGGVTPAWPDGAMTPEATPPGPRRWLAPLLVVGWAIHVAALSLVVLTLWPAIRVKLGDLGRLRRESPVRWACALTGPLVIGLLLCQGLWQSQHLVGHVWTLSGGDDWLSYEAISRDGVLDGLMLSEGGVIGRGQPFAVYPGYAYFVALIHAVTGETLAGVVLVNFLLLAAATLVAGRIALRLFGPAAAIGSVVWLLALEQAAFVRYYTVTLFSENLYFVLAALTVWWLIVHVQSGGWRPIVYAALAGALASITRPSMMLLLPVALVIAAAARWRRDGPARVAAASALFVVVWFAALSPITLRNYLMSGRAVLITAGQAVTFVVYNMPTNDPKYLKDFDGTLLHGAWTLAWMFVEHPIASLETYGVKLGFSLGMVHWMGSTGTVHPELILTSLLYFTGFAFLPAMRTFAALPLHAFVVTHVATLMLTMPSNYGYRMVLPAFVLMSTAAGALAVRPLYQRAVRIWPALGRGGAEAAS